MLCIVLALINGIAIGMSRALNGQLSTHAGPFRASQWNHVVGFLFLSLMLLMMGWPRASDLSLPVSAYLGGVFGALFVAINSFVFIRLGATRAALLVIGGQMLSAVLIDWQHQQQAPGILRCAGLAVLLLGMYLSRASRKSN
nr:DMT family transporter [Paludibacterium purpuratum]